jgi:hypothetical protein
MSVIAIATILLAIIAISTANPYTDECQGILNYATRVMQSEPYPTKYIPVEHDVLLLSRLQTIKTRAIAEPACHPPPPSGYFASWFDFGESQRQLESRINLRLLHFEISGLDTQLRQQRLVKLAVWGAETIMAIGTASCVLLTCCWWLWRRRNRNRKERQLQQTIVETLREVQLMRPSYEEAESIVREIEQGAANMRRRASGQVEEGRAHSAA